MKIPLLGAAKAGKFARESIRDGVRFKGDFERALAVILGLDGPEQVTKEHKQKYIRKNGKSGVKTLVLEWRAIRDSDILSDLRKKMRR